MLKYLGVKNQETEFNRFDSFGQLKQLPLSQSMDQLSDAGLEVKIKPDFSTERTQDQKLEMQQDLDYYYDEESAQLISSLRKKYTDEQIMQLLKKMENEKFLSNFNDLDPEPFMTGENELS